MKNKILIWTLLIISFFSIIFTVSYLTFLAIEPPNGNGGLPPEKIELEAPVLDPIDPGLVDKYVELTWSKVDVPLDPGDTIYIIERSKDGGSWIKCIYTYETSYFDPLNIYSSLENGVYEYRVKAIKITNDYDAQSDYSNIEFIIVDIKSPPSNPSIEINDGDLTTNSFTISLTLSCDNADEMMFQIDIGTWINWTDYTTTYTLTLQEEYLDDNKFYIGVTFRNEDGESNEVFDEITYESEGEPPPNGDDNGDDKTIDYTLTYILLGVLGSLIGIGVFLKYRKSIIKSN